MTLALGLLSLVIVYNIHSSTWRVAAAADDDAESAVTVDDTDDNNDCHTREGGDSKHQPTILEPASDYMTEKQRLASSLTATRRLVPSPSSHTSYLASSLDALSDDSPAESLCNADVRRAFLPEPVRNKL